MNCALGHLLERRCPMRIERYRDLLPADRLMQSACTVVGIGAIGRQVCLQLAAMGVGLVQLVDFDSVEVVNLGTQIYLENDIGKPKVHATAELMAKLNHELQIEEHCARFGRTMHVHPVVFCCVDSIHTRRHIWSAIQDRIDLFVDGRMAAEVLRVLTVTDSSRRDRYSKTLFSQNDAHPQACTARATIYCASVAAGIMVGHFTKWLRRLPTDFDVSVNLLSMEFLAV